MAILVTGGAGYIGSVEAELLHARGEQVVVLDNLSRGHRNAVPAGIAFYAGDVGDRRLVARITRDHDLEACLHFAAFAYVGESVSDPANYFENNVQQGIGLIDELTSGRCAPHRVLFNLRDLSGEPDRVPITEDHPLRPANPYGHTKLIIERVLQSYDQAYGVKFVAPRHSNVLREQPKTLARITIRISSHCLNVLAVARGLSPYVRVFGSD